MRAARGLHTQRAGAAIGWRSQISLAQVRVGRAPMCQRRRASTSRKLAAAAAPALSASSASATKLTSSCQPSGQHVARSAPYRSAREERGGSAQRQGREGARQTDSICSRVNFGRLLAGSSSHEGGALDASAGRLVGRTTMGSGAS